MTGKTIVKAIVALTVALALCVPALGAQGVTGGRLQSSLYEAPSFTKSLAAAVPYPLSEKPVAGVVPHHLLAADMTASFLGAASAYEYESVVLLAPSHFTKGERLYTTTLDWDTPFGVLENDRLLTETIAGSGRPAVLKGDTLIGADHSVVGLVPYIKHYFPDATLSVVLLENLTREGTIEALVERLLKAAGEKDMLLLCSVDFSHYLDSAATAAADQKTRQVLGRQNPGEILACTDQNFDSPATVLAFLSYLKGRGRTLSILDNGVSSEFLTLSPTDPAFREGLTSYFILAG